MIVSATLHIKRRRHVCYERYFCLSNHFPLFWIGPSLELYWLNLVRSHWNQLTKYANIKHIHLYLHPLNAIKWRYHHSSAKCQSQTNLSFVEQWTLSVEECVEWDFNFNQLILMTLILFSFMLMSILLDKTEWDYFFLIHI